MNNIFYKEGLILKITEKPLVSKSGNFWVIDILGLENEKTTVSLFDINLIDQLTENEVYTFKIEKKGNFQNLLDISEASPDIISQLQGSVTDFKEVKQVKKEEKEPAITKNHMIVLQGKEYITHEGLLYLAHKKGLKSIVTEIVEFQDKELAVVKATTTMKDGSVFTGYGDANTDNVNRMIAKHLLRMAETRAINRSLRLGIGIGMTSVEELEG